MSTISSSSQHYQLMEKAITYLHDHFKEQPTLAEVAQFVGLSESHFQRLFQQWVGVSPKQFVQYLTATHARQLLQACKDTLSVTYETGLSSSSRLHDVLVKIYASTPAELRNQGVHLTITYGFHDTPFGACLIALSERGLCHLAFLAETEAMALQELQDSWPFAQLVQNQEDTAPYIAQIFGPHQSCPNLQLHLKGTPFQIQVWEALLRIPPGRVVTYEAVAQSIGKPQAYRAAATAVGKNPIAFLIPCHRVIRNTGVVGQYRWGQARKRMLLGWESAQSLSVGISVS